MAILKAQDLLSFIEEASYTFYIVPAAGVSGGWVGGVFCIYYWILHVVFFQGAK